LFVLVAGSLPENKPQSFTATLAAPVFPATLARNPLPAMISSLHIVNRNHFVMIWVKRGHAGWRWTSSRGCDILAGWKNHRCSNRFLPLPGKRNAECGLPFWPPVWLWPPLPWSWF
jgi:hypothetical protein